MMPAANEFLPDFPYRPDATGAHQDGSHAPVVHIDAVGFDATIALSTGVWKLVRRMESGNVTLEGAASDLRALMEAFDQALAGPDQEADDGE